MIGFLGTGRHGRLRELLSAYMDGQVSASEAGRVERHLSQCSECRAELEMLKATVGLLRRLPQLEVPRSFALTETPQPIRAVPTIVWGARLATSAAAVLLVTLLVGDFAGVVSQSKTLDEVAVKSLAKAPVAVVEKEVVKAVVKEVVVEKEVMKETAAEREMEAQVAVEVEAVAEVEAVVETDEAVRRRAMQAAPTTQMPPRTAPAEEEMAVEEAVAAPSETEMVVRELVSSEVAPRDLQASPGPVAAKALAPGGAFDTQEDAVPAAEPSPQIPLEAISGDGEPVEPEGASGFTLPLRQLELATAGLLFVLVLATLWAARRRGRRSPWTAR